MTHNPRPQVGHNPCPQGAFYEAKEAGKLPTSFASLHLLPVSDDRMFRYDTELRSFSVRFSMALITVFTFSNIDRISAYSSFDLINYFSLLLICKADAFSHCKEFNLNMSGSGYGSSVIIEPDLCVF